VSKSSEIRSWAIASAGVFCLCAVSYRVLSAPPLPDLRPIVATINHPCKPGPCGTLAKIDQTMNVADGLMIGGNKAILDADHVALTESAMLPVWNTELTTTLSAAQGAIATANEQLTHVAPVLDASRTAIDALPPAIKSLTDGIRPVLANADGAVTDVRTFINAPALSATVANVAAVTGNANGIVGDFRQIADKETADFLKPVPWYMKPIKRAGEIMDIGAAVARNAP
jgi:hypothetical protein